MPAPADKASALDALIRSGIAIASDTAEYNKISAYNPTDATTNPSLVFAAVSKPEYAELIDRAVQYAVARHPPAPLDTTTELAMDHLLAQVGAQIARLIPGRVSVSVDPRLAYDQDAITAKARALVSLLGALGVPRERVLVKIPATYPGILAGRALASAPAPIHANLTLVFGSVQALACAQAGVAVVSPFVGRVQDWCAARDRRALPRFRRSRTPEPGTHAALSAHAGLLLVREIRGLYDAHGFSGRTEIMAAGFRSADEVVELGKTGRAGGPDLLTLPPEMLASLSARHEGAGGADGRAGAGQTSAGGGSRRTTQRSSPPAYMPTAGSDASARYASDLADEKIAMDKVPEGLEKFAADVRVLESILRERVRLLLA